ncbi:hypothetical protein PFISCL1PPCAC_22531, partial [Pristionchus fissidentatus]
LVSPHEGRTASCGGLDDERDLVSSSLLYSSIPTTPSVLHVVGRSLLYLFSSSSVHNRSIHYLFLLLSSLLSKPLCRSFLLFSSPIFNSFFFQLIFSPLQSVAP